MKKIGLSLLGIIVIAAIAWFIFAPAWFEKQTNMVDGKPLPEITAEAKALHDSLFIVDLHGDTLLWKRKITDSVDYGHIDLERLQRGNIGLQIFSSVTKTPRGQNYDSNSAETDNITLLAISQLQPMRTWFSLLERQLYHAEKLKHAVEISEGGMSLVTSAEDAGEISRLREFSGSQKRSGTGNWCPVLCRGFANARRQTREPSETLRCRNADGRFGSFL